MANVQQAMKAKSDQLNYVDIGEGEITIQIESVQVTNSDQQPVFVYYVGCNNRPYKPSKGMIRVLAGAWGEESDMWIGKSLKLFGDSTVTFGKGEVGGIRIRSMSHVAPHGYTAFIQKNRSTRVKQTIPLLIVEPVYYDEARFNSELPAMLDAIKSESMTAQDIINQCANLSDDQVKRLHV
tara:strand:+ start:611 stop:1153 length:543 start_codon:yes stop_codon:yes gene_type:complete